jgi:hypothetical protein
MTNIPMHELNRLVNMGRNDMRTKFYSVGYLCKDIFMRPYYVAVIRERSIFAPQWRMVYFRLSHTKAYGTEFSEFNVAHFYPRFNDARMAVTKHVKTDRNINR